MEGPWILGCWQKEAGWGDGNDGHAAAEMTMGKDEVGWNPVAPEITGALGMVNTDGEILVHFKMQVWRIHAVVCPDCSDLLTSAHLFSFTHDDPIEMAVEGIGEVKLPMLNPSVTDNDDISPVGMNVAGQNNNAVSDCIDGALKAFCTAAIGDPILTQMSPGAKSPRFGVTLSVRRGHRKVKTIRRAG